MHIHEIEKYQGTAARPKLLYCTKNSGMKPSLTFAISYLDFE